MKKEKLPVWDLSEYYNGVDDVNIDKDLQTYEKKAKSFYKKYKGRVKDLSDDEYLNAFKELESLKRIAGKLGGFAHLNATTNMLDLKATALYQKVEEKLSEAGTNLVFWSLEYNKLSEKKQNELIKKIPQYHDLKHPIAPH